MMLRSIDGGGRVHSALAVRVVALMALLLSPAALAQRMHGGGGAQWGGHAGGFHQFSGRGGFAGGRSAFVNRGGFSHHRGHFGAAVVIGGGLGFWYPAVYPYPYYTYPAYYPYDDAYPAYDASVAVPAYNMPPPVQSWYYCDAAGAYYPYVASCPGGWREVPATPPAPAQR